jgi:hypothetical protein
MKPEQQEIERLKREVYKLKAERDSYKGDDRAFGVLLALVVRKYCQAVLAL